MKKCTAILGSIPFFFAAPGIVAGLLPWLRTDWRMGPAFFGFGGVRIAGGIFVPRWFPRLTAWTLR